MNITKFSLPKLKNTIFVNNTIFSVQINFSEIQNMYVHKLRSMHIQEVFDLLRQYFAGTLYEIQYCDSGIIIKHNKNIPFPGKIHATCDNTYLLLDGTYDTRDIKPINMNVKKNYINEPVLIHFDRFDKNSYIYLITTWDKLDNLGKNNVTRVIKSRLKSIDPEIKVKFNVIASPIIIQRIFSYTLHSYVFIEFQNNPNIPKHAPNLCIENMYICDDKKYEFITHRDSQGDIILIPRGYYSTEDLITFYRILESYNSQVYTTNGHLFELRLINMQLPKIMIRDLLYLDFVNLTKPNIAFGSVVTAYNIDNKYVIKYDKSLTQDQNELILKNIKNDLDIKVDQYEIQTIYEHKQIAIIFTTASRVEYVKLTQSSIAVF